MEEAEIIALTKKIESLTEELTELKDTMDTVLDAISTLNEITDELFTRVKK